MNGWRALFPNAWFVAVREFRSRVRTRSFVLGTILLAVLSFAATQLPVLIDFSMATSQTKVAVVVRATDMPSDSQALLDAQLNGQSSDPGAHKAFVLTWLPAEELAAAQAGLEKRDYDALLVIDRDPSTGDLAFTLRTDAPQDGPAIKAARVALESLVVEDRLVRAGTSTAALRAPFSLTVAPVSATSTGPKSVSSEVSTSLLSTGLIVLIFMAIVTYGVWVAMSVAEEKGSRVMELMLNATSPLQMLAGKMLGNGAAGLTQYGVILAAVVGGLILQGPIHKAVLGTDSGAGFGGLSPLVLGAFVVLFILGFTLYSLLYAALGSLVSRQEDVQSATSPLMMLIMVGYLMSVLGLQAIDETWVRLASFVPFFSPYLMLARVAVGHVEAWEFVLAVLLLAISCAAALVVAARIYSAGVLLYGQRVSLAQILKAARASR
jgi:ABC-2 type transport system permease protein